MARQTRRLMQTILLMAAITNVSGCAAFVILGAASDVAVTGVKATTSVITAVTKTIISDDQQTKK